MIFRRLLAGTAMVAMVTGLAVPAFAQDSAGDNAAQASDEIVVSGIRKSLSDAIDAKRASDSIVDAISAEDVGKLPDRNIAEALQRVPGVAIQRNRGEGDFVSIRGLGPEFVRGSVNGRTIVSATETFNSTLNGGSGSSTGRETNFDVLPSEVIQLMEVSKTASANQIEGGIGGTVNIKTARPLDMNSHVTVSARGTYSDLAKATSPSIAGVASWRNDAHTFGLVGSVSYSKREIRQDVAESFGYIVDLFGEPNFFDSTLSGVGNYRNVSFPFSSNMSSFVENRERLTFSGTAQWSPDDSTNLSIDAIYSERKVNSTEHQLIMETIPGFFDFINNPRTGTTPSAVGDPNAPSYGVINPDGSIQFAGLQVNGTNTAVRFPSIADFIPLTDLQTGKDTLFNIGGNFSKEWDGWKAEADVSYSKASGRNGFVRSVSLLAQPMTNPNGAANFLAVPVMVDTTSGSIVATPNPTIGIIQTTNYTVVPLPGMSTLSNPNYYLLRNYDNTMRLNDDKEFSASASLSHDLDGSLLKSIEFGARFASRTKNIQDFIKRGTPGGVRLNFASFNIPTVAGPNDFFGGSFPFDLSQVIFPADPLGNLQKSLATAGLAANAFDPRANAVGTFKVDEKTLAGYAMARIDTKLGELPLTGNVGVRVVNTSSDITSYGEAFTIVFNGPPGSPGTPVFSGNVLTYPAHSSYTNVLPSANFKLGVADDVFVRAAYSKTISRPVFSDLGGLDFNATQLIVNKRGNPNLKPFASQNFDLGFEWYFGKTGILSSNFFYKKLDDFITSTTTTNVSLYGVNWTSVTQPENQSGGTIKGVEITYQQPFTFLPSPLDGFGSQLNFTFSDGELNLRNGTPVSFPGISKSSFNGALYYEKGPISLRLAYTKRSKYLMMPDAQWGQQLWHAPYQQLDLSATFKVVNGIEVFGDITNLTNETDMYFSTDQAHPAFDMSRPLSRSMVGRRFGFGARASF